jgi:hypothetical protein
MVRRGFGLREGSPSTADHRYEACRAVNVYVHAVRCHLLGRADFTLKDRPRWVFTGYRLPTSRGLGAVALVCVRPGAVGERMG